MDIVASTDSAGGRWVVDNFQTNDNNVNGSGTWEHNALSMGPASSYCNEKQEEWWGHSVLFPADFVFPPGPESGIVFDFHNSGSTGQANFEIQTVPGMGLRLRGRGVGLDAGVSRHRTMRINYDRIRMVLALLIE